MQQESNKNTDTLNLTEQTSSNGEICVCMTVCAPRKQTYINRLPLQSSKTACFEQHDSQ